MTHRTWRKDCKTYIEEIPQSEWKEKQHLGKAARESSSQVATPLARLTLSSDTPVTPMQADKILTLYGRLQRRAIEQIETTSRETTVVEMISCLEDAIDVILQDPLPSTDQSPTAFMALLDAGFQLVEAEDMVKKLSALC